MKTQKFIPLSQPNFSSAEKTAVIKAFDSGWVTLGPKTAEFEVRFAKYVGAKYAVAVSSATAGLHLAIITAGVGREDEVIAPVFTFAATINPVIHEGGTPVLVDIDKKTFTIDTKKVERFITKKTKAIIPVHYGGGVVDMDAIVKLARKYKLVIIEDAAHAVASTYKGKRIGTIGDMTVFSFHPIKNITTGDGGMVTTDNEEYAAKIRLLRLHGMNKEAWKRFSKSGSWYYEITAPGYKYNMTDISAVIGIEQLKRLPKFQQKRKEIIGEYTKAFSKHPLISVPFIPEYTGHAWNLYSILLDVGKLDVSRNEFIELLKEKNIGSAVYFTPLHFHPYYRDTYKLKQGDFPNAEWVYERIVNLPMSSKMTINDARHVIKSVLDVLASHTIHE